jgi:8-oxo-dGTP pyrophosphatase MutT (NUDIX family)
MSDTWEEDGDPWTVKSVTRRFENAWLALDLFDVVHPNGADGTYTVVRPHRLAVGVLPIEPDGSVHLVGQWRFPLGRYSWEMPEGGADPGEDPLDCARRELEEETGLIAGRYERMLEMDLSNSITDERAIIYLAFDLKSGEAKPEATEVLRRRRAHFLDVLERVTDGRIRDAMTVAAVLRAHHMAVTEQLPQGLRRAMLAHSEGERNG